MSPYFKKAASFICVASLLFVQGVAVAQAQGAAAGAANTATNIAPVNPISTTGGQALSGGGGYQPISGMRFGGDFGSMLAELFRWIVSITIILAVIMLVLGGVQYMGSESLFGKSEGKDRIVAALGGLMIALVSIFVLNLILGTGGPGDFIVNLGF